MSQEDSRLLSKYQYLDGVDGLDSDAIWEQLDIHGENMTTHSYQSSRPEDDLRFVRKKETMEVTQEQM